MEEDTEETRSPAHVEYIVEFDNSATVEHFSSQEFIVDFVSALSHNRPGFSIEEHNGTEKRYKILVLDDIVDLRHSPRNVGIFEMFKQNKCVMLKHIDILNCIQVETNMSNGRCKQPAEGIRREGEGEDARNKPKTETLISMDAKTAPVMSLREAEEMILVKEEGLKTAREVRSERTAREDALRTVRNEKTLREDTPIKKWPACDAPKAHQDDAVPEPIQLDQDATDTEDERSSDEEIVYASESEVASLIGDLTKIQTGSSLTDDESSTGGAVLQVVKSKLKDNNNVVIRISMPEKDDELEIILKRRRDAVELPPSGKYSVRVEQDQTVSRTSDSTEVEFIRADPAPLPGLSSCGKVREMVHFYENVWRS